jgi:hypothetical protein
MFYLVQKQFSCHSVRYLTLQKYSYTTTDLNIYLMCAYSRFDFTIRIYFCDTPDYYSRLINSVSNILI